jgi:hypothetical protein
MIGDQPRRTIVTDVKHATGGKLAAGDVYDRCAVLVGNPRPNTMRDDHIELRQILASGELRKREIENARPGPGGFGHVLSVCGMHRVEIDSPKFSRTRGGMNVERQPLPETELEVAWNA